MTQTEKYILIVLFLITPFIIESQKYYHQWPIGYGEDTTMNFGLSLLDFNNASVDRMNLRPSLNYWVGSNSSFICERNGQLKLYTNGCAILNAQREVIPNGDTLSPGFVFDVYCPQSYLGFHKTLMLPDLEDDRYTLVLYKDGVVTPMTELFSDRLYMSIVYSDSPDQHQVIVKSKPIRDTRALYDGLAAIPHVNGRDWWVIEARGIKTNEWLTYLVNKDSIRVMPSQNIGLPMDIDTYEGGQFVFSPDGSKITYSRDDKGIAIMDFDRNTGTLSNHRLYQEPWMSRTDSTIIDGTCFSPDSRILYVTNSLSLYQIIEENINSPIQHIASITKLFDDYSGFPLFLGDMNLGPDCRIYIAPRSTAGAIHVIEYPNIVGLGCGLKIKAFNMPSRVSNILPDYAFYHLAKGISVCDSTIRGITTNTIEIANKLKAIVFPNPSSGEIEIKFDKIFTGRIKFYAMDGRLVKSSLVFKKEHFKFKEILESGTYVLFLINSNGEYASQTLLIQN